MTEIVRDLKKSSQEPYDLIIVGGGIYGVMLSFEAVRRNLRPLMLEKNDFINATSLNHLRTVHGGLRYLQSLDLPRFKESVAERKWFLKYFPQFIDPIPCLMPLYGKGLQRKPILWAGLLLNDMLSFNRNFSVQKDRHLPNGKIISPQQTGDIFRGVDGNGLEGGAVWYDAAVEEYQRLMMELLKSAVNSGAAALNYVKVKELLKENGHVSGVQTVDEETGDEYKFKAPVVINAAGPWSREMAELFDKDQPPLFKKRLLLWNVLFNREAMSKHALALSPEKGKGRSYFFHIWKNRLLVGTGELIVEKSNGELNIPAREMENFIHDINKMAPGLNIKESDIQRVYSGILPANEQGKLAKRPVVVDHAANGGPKGLYSISGIKFTTSRRVADKTLDKVFPKAKKMPHENVLETPASKNLSFDYDWEPENEADLNILKDILQKESVLHLSDLILRRTSLGDHPERAIKILPKIRGIFAWNDKKWDEEVQELKENLEL